MRRKRFFITAIVCLAVIFAVYTYYAAFSSPLGENSTPYPENNDGNSTEPWKFPKINFPWSANDSSGGSGSQGGGSAGSGSSPSAGGEGNVIKQALPKNNFTLFVNSTHNLQVSVKYLIDDVAYNETRLLPFSVDVQENTYACLSETTRSGTIRWLIENGTDCPFSDCGGTLYDCELYMNGNYSLTLRQYS
jgi:hypothetical protein